MCGRGHSSDRTISAGWTRGDGGRRGDLDDGRPGETTAEVRPQIIPVGGTAAPVFVDPLGRDSLGRDCYDAKGHEVCGKPCHNILPVLLLQYTVQVNCS